nr:uncharacterized protein LOC117681790 [Crassostrea gigas]
MAGMEANRCAELVRLELLERYDACGCRSMHEIWFIPETNCICESADSSSLSDSWSSSARCPDFPVRRHSAWFCARRTIGLYLRPTASVNRLILPPSLTRGPHLPVAQIFL